jgi:hypothetical protein
MRKDTRQLLRVGLSIFVTGAVAALSMLYVFGGIERRQGPHTTAGWLALMVAMACLPCGVLTLLLGFAKLAGDRSRIDAG